MKNIHFIFFDTILHLFTLFSKRINVRTFRHISTPRSSNGKCKGKSTRENLVWSGRAKHSGGCMFDDIISTSTRVFAGTGTGLLSKRSIQVSISRTSWSTMDDVSPRAWPVKTLHTVSL